MEVSKKKKILTVIFIVLSVAVIVTAVALLIPTLSEGENGGSGKDKKNKDDIFQGYIPYLINSDSMAPALKNGDVLLAEKVKNVNELKIGDVIVYETIIADASGKLARAADTKRIVEIVCNQDGTISHFITKGDAMTMEDTVPVTPETILAKQVGSGVDENGKIKNGLKIENFEEEYGDFDKYVK